MITRIQRSHYERKEEEGGIKIHIALINWLAFPRPHAKINFAEGKESIKDKPMKAKKEGNRQNA